MRILVAGATGTLGGMIIHRLLAEGHTVRAMVRRPDAAPALPAGVETVFGDLKHPGSLRLACQGVDVVVTTANSAQRGGEDNVETVEIEGNRNLSHAAFSAGVGHYVFVSAVGADPASPVPFLRGKGLAEAQLQRSGLSWTILRPNFFMEVWVGMMVVAPVAANGPVTLVGEGLRRHSMISIDDVAAFAAAAATHPAARRRVLALGGPEALSWRDIVAAAERVAGHPIRVRTIPPGQPLPGAPQVVSDLAARLDTFDSPIDMAETAAAFGVRLTPLDEYLARALPRSVPA